MKHELSAVVVVLLVVGVAARVAWLSPLFAAPEPLHVVPIMQTVAPPPSIDPPASSGPAPVLDDRRARLEAYVLGALTAWTKRSREELAPLSAVAHQIAEVVSDPNEPALFDDDPDKAKSAILLATITWFEGGELARVYDGSCNDPAWRKTKEGARFVARFPCDGGYAWSLGQVHPEGGVVLTPDGEWKSKYDAPAGSVAIDGRTMIDRPDLAMRVVLHMLRKSLRRTGGLSGYSGEGNTAPKARARLDFARGWSRKHPFNP